MGQLEISEVGALQLFETNKNQRFSFAEAVIKSINDGMVSALDVHYYLKCMADISNQITDHKEYNPLLRAEAEKYGKEFEYKNSNIKLQEVGTKYDYSKCNDTELDLLSVKAKDIEELLKNRQKFLKLAPLSGIDIIDDNGEVKKVYPPIKTSTSSVVVKLK
jgi:hypothetical protein